MVGFTYRIGPLPGIGGTYYRLADGKFAIGRQAGTWSDVYARYTKQCADASLHGVIGEAIDLGATLDNKGWLGATAIRPKYYHRDRGVGSILTARMWSLGQAAPGTEYELWFARHTIKWTQGDDRLTVEVNGDDMAFDAVALDRYFARLYTRGDDE